jgi:hypothetical protein
MLLFAGFPKKIAELVRSYSPAQPCNAIVQCWSGAKDWMMLGEVSLDRQGGMRLAHQRRVVL